MPRTSAYVTLRGSFATCRIAMSYPDDNTATIPSRARRPSIAPRACCAELVIGSRHQCPRTRRSGGSARCSRRSGRWRSDGVIRIYRQLIAQSGAARSAPGRLWMLFSLIRRSLLPPDRCRDAQRQCGRLTRATSPRTNRAHDRRAPHDRWNSFEFDSRCGKSALPKAPAPSASAHPRSSRTSREVTVLP